MRGMKSFGTQPAPQNFADGGAVGRIKGMLGFKPAEYRAELDRSKQAALSGYKDGGMVRGPGTSTSDEVPDEVPEGTYIMPADSTQAVGAQKLHGLGAKNIPVNLSNGEFKMPPEQVHAVGVQALDQMKAATHTPAAAQARGMKPELFFADGGVVGQKKEEELVGQIPTGGPKAPAPDGRSDTELSRNINNSMNAMGGMGVVASVPLRQPPASTALATVAPSAGFASGALAKMGELATGTAPQAAQAARGLPGTIAGLQEGAQANSYAAAGRTLGGASAGATALDNDRPADPMAPPKVNSFGDASAVARGSSAALPSAGALSMGTAPQVSPQASPQVTTPEARKAVGLFPYSHPDAGANIYAGVGFSNGGEQQAAGAANDSRRIDSLVSQIPGNGGAPAPAANGSQGSWRDTELGRNVNNAMMALPGIGGMARVANTGGAISTGLNAASTGINAASRMAALGAGVTERGFAPAAPSTPAATPNANPYASVTPEQGRAMAEINAKAQSQPGQPQEGRDIDGGITRIDRPGHSPLFTDNKDPDMARFLARPAGGPTKEVSDIMQRMSDKSQNEAFGRFQREANSAQYSREVQQAQAINAAGGENARNVQNRMDQEKNLRKLDIKASSAGSLIERMTAQKAYNAALAQDAGFRAGADAGSVARTQNEGATARERVQQAGATERVQMQEDGQNSRAGQTQGLAQQKLGMEQEAQGFSSRAAAQQEQLRNVLLNPNATPEQRKVAQRSLSALSGKTAADRMQTVALPDTVDNGQVVRGGQALVRTLEDGTVEQVPIGAQGQGGAAGGRAIGSTSTLNGKTAVWDGAKWVPRG